MKKFLALLVINLMSLNVSAQGTGIIPTGITKDSIYADFINSSLIYVRKHSFYYYKPASYNPAISPIILAMHGTGGSGQSIIANLITIADRRNAMIIAPNLEQAGCIRPQEAVTVFLDSIDGCGVNGPATLILKEMYKHTLARENRTAIPTYMIGFSSGGQFVSRYMLIRQAYPDSIPIQMAVSANAYYYAFPTDTFSGVAMPWLCGLQFNPITPGYCVTNLKFYTFNCTEHIKQYYGENYGVLIGNADLTPLSDAPCAMIQGSNRYQRAQTFYNFGVSDAPNYGINCNWQYKEVPGVGHDETQLYNNKDLPTDSFTIAEKLLFDTPHNTVIQTAPVAGFYANATHVYLPSATVNFINTSTLASNYFWDFGDGSTSTQMSPSHTYTSTGYFMVQLSATNSAGCDNWQIRRHYILVDNITGKRDNISVNFSINLIPNPSDSEFSVVLSGMNDKESKIEIAVYNYSGQLVKEAFKDKISGISQKWKVETGSFSSGIYFVKTTYNGMVKIEKLVINH